MSSIIGLVLAGVAAYWVYNDATSRGMNAIVWAIFTFLILIIGLPAYLLMRKPKLSETAGNDTLDHLVDDDTV